MAKDASEYGWQQFLSLCTRFKNPSDFNHLFSLFLTIDEKAALSTRYLIVKALLKDEQTQRELAESIPVSIAKITRGSNSLKQIDVHFKRLLKQYIQTSQDDTGEES